MLVFMSLGVHTGRRAPALQSLCVAVVRLSVCATPLAAADGARQLGVSSVIALDFDKMFDPHGARTLPLDETGNASPEEELRLSLPVALLAWLMTIGAVDREYMDLAGLEAGDHIPTRGECDDWCGTRAGAPWGVWRWEGGGAACLGGAHRAGRSQACLPGHVRGHDEGRHPPLQEGGCVD